MCLYSWFVFRGGKIDFSFTQAQVKAQLGFKLQSKCKDQVKLKLFESIP